MAKYAIMNSISYSQLSTDSEFFNASDTANGKYGIYITTGPAANTYNYGTGSYSGSVTTYIVKLSNSLGNIIIPPTSTDSVRAIYYMFSPSGGNYYRHAYKRSYNSQVTYDDITQTITLFDKEYYGGRTAVMTNSSWNVTTTSGIFEQLTEEIESQEELETLLTSLGIRPIADTYPITYSSSNSTVSGPSEAAVGDTVTVSAVPDVGYGITDASTQILVTNNDVAVPYTWDAANNRITFTMPDPS